MESNEIKIPKQFKIGAYKLKELAKIENLHYQTILERKKRGVYVAIVTRSGRSSTQSYRYMTLEASNAFRAIFSTMSEYALFFPTVPEEPETPPAGTVEEKPVVETDTNDTF